MTVRIENSSLVYPRSLVLLPGNFSIASRRILFHQLSPDVTNHWLRLEPISEAVHTVLRAAELMLKANNSNGSDVDRPRQALKNTPAMLLYVVVNGTFGPGERNRQSRKSKSAGTVRRVRSAYSSQWQGLCETCSSMVPQQPLVINIIKTGSGCGDACSYPQSKPASCEEPQCESHFPHHQLMFHPPPPPPAHFHHYPPPPPPPHFHHYPPPPPPPHFHHYPPPPPPPHFHPYTPPAVFQPQSTLTSPSTPARPVNNTPKPVVLQPQNSARPSSAPPVNQCDPCAPTAFQPAAPISFGGSFSQSSASAQSSSFTWAGQG